MGLTEGPPCWLLGLEGEHCVATERGSEENRETALTEAECGRVHFVLVCAPRGSSLTASRGRTHRFKCTRRIGGTFQISSFFVESLRALQCLQNTLLLSVSFSSLENNFKQS